MRRCIILAVSAAASFVMAGANSDSWFTRTSPAMTGDERNAYRKLSSEAEREGFRLAFWNGKAVLESDYMERVAHADGMYGSGREGSGANTDQGRLYIASGPPTAIHRLPSSRIFVACEVWQYDSLPGTGYKSRLQFLFFRKASAGDFRLYWPGLHSIRDLLIPQPGTRLMFPVNDIVTANDIRDRLHYSPAEEEIVEASTGIARGITGSGNGEILGRATSISAMVHQGTGSLPVVASKFSVADAPEIRAIQFWSGEVPVSDIQVRTKASKSIALSLDSVTGPNKTRTRLENTSIPLGLEDPKPVLYTQRFFLPPGQYLLTVTIDGFAPYVKGIQVTTDRQVTGEALTPNEGDLRISMLTDPQSADAKQTIAGRLSN